MSRRCGKKKVKKDTETDRAQGRRLLDFLLTDAEGITMTPPNPRKREAAESPPSDTSTAPKRQRSSTSSADSSITLTLDNMFEFLIEKPDHKLYSQNVARLVDEALDNTDLHSSVTKPLEHLLQAIQQRCSGNSHAEKVLFTRVGQQFVERILQGLAPCSSSSGSTSQKHVVCLPAGPNTIRLEVTIAPLADADDGVKPEPGLGDSISAQQSSISAQQSNIPAQQINIPAQQSSITPAQRPWHQPEHFPQLRFGMPGFQPTEPAQRQRPVRVGDSITANTANEPFRGHVGNYATFPPVPDPAATGFGSKPSVPDEPNLHSIGRRLRSVSLAPSVPGGENGERGAKNVNKSGAHDGDRARAAFDQSVVKQETGPGAGGEFGTSEEVWTVKDSSHSVDGCLCLQDGRIIKHNDIKKAEMKLGLRKISGLRDSTQLDKNALEGALRDALGRRANFSSVIPYDTGMMAACFMGENSAARHAGRVVAVSQSTFRLIKLDNPSSRVFVCSGLPIGPKALTEESLMHSLVHLFPDQGRLHVKMGRTQSALPGHYHHTVLVMLAEARNIKSFSFTLEMKNGSGEAAGSPYDCIFETVDVGNGASCVACNSHAHTTIMCPSLKPVALMTEHGLYRKFRTSVPP